MSIAPIVLQPHPASEYSKNVDSYGYDEPSRELRVQFKTGVTYRYKDVPPDIVRNFLESTSPGSFVHTDLKGAFDAEKVTEDDTNG